MNVFTIQLKSRQSVFSSILLTEGCACDLRGAQAAHSNKTLSEISAPEGVSVSMCASADCLNVVDVLTIGFLYAHLVATLLGCISFRSPFGSRPSRFKPSWGGSL